MVHHGYSRCPHFRGTKQAHIVQLICLLVGSLVETKVHEVTTDLKGQESLDFDAMLLVSSTAVAYPEQYRACLQDWLSRSQDRDLQGEVLDFVTPVKTIHHNMVCDIECCNYALVELN